MPYSHFSAFQQRYATFLRLAMSAAEAKVILGFPSYANPSMDEVSKAWKSLAFQNHPDRGGDPRKMVELNVAKDVLTGKRNERFRPEPAPKPAPKPPEPVVTIPGTSFEDAWKGSPATDWKLSSTLYGTSNKDSKASVHFVFLYGQTSSAHVVAATALTGEHWVSTETPKKMQAESWESFVLTAPLTMPLEKAFPKMWKALMSEVKGSYTITYDPKKYFPWVGGHVTPSTLSKSNRGQSYKIKDIFSVLGLISEDSQAAKARKTLVLFTVKSNAEKRKRLLEQGERYLTAINSCDWILSIDGKEVILTDKTAEKLSAFWAVSLGGDFGKTYNISNLKGGRNTYSTKVTAAEAMKHIKDSLVGEPAWVSSALSKAEQENSKTASYRYAW